MTMKTIFLSLGLMLATATAFAATQTQSNQDKPWRIFLLGDAQNLDAITDYKVTITNMDGTVRNQWEFQSAENYNHAWVSGLGGNGSLYESEQDLLPDFYTGQPYIYAGSFTGGLIWDWSGLGEETDIYPNYTNTYTISIFDRIGNEHCDVNDSGDPTAIKRHKVWLGNTYMNSYLPRYMDWEPNPQDAYTRKAQTVWHVQTGGKAVPGLLNLWQFNGSAWEVLDKRALPPFTGIAMREITNKTQIAIGSMGDLMTNGIRYNLLPNDAEFDVTPNVAGKDFYTFNVNGQKYCSYFEVYVRQPNPGTSTTFSDYNGHAFWGLTTDAPEEAIQLLSPSLQTYINSYWGFYPHGADCGLPGWLQNDYDHNYDVERVFYIGFNNLISGLQFTREIDNTPPEYCYRSYSCVGATQDAGRRVGIALPSFPILDLFPQNFGADIVKQFPGPLADSTPRYSK